VVALERQLKQLVRKGVGVAAASVATTANATARFVAKDCGRSARGSPCPAAEFGKLVA